MWGWVLLVLAAMPLCGALWYVFLSAPKPLPNHEFAARYGPWALVTGAAAGGIGECFALELASRGVHVLLTGRQREPLLATRANLLRRFPDAQCAVVDGVDMARDDCVTALEAAAARALPPRARTGEPPAPVSVDHAHAGASSSSTSDVWSRFGLFVLNHTATDGGQQFLSGGERGVQPQLDILHANARAYTLLAHAFGSVATARRRGGLLLMTSASYVGSPYLSMYTATKALQLTLGTVLHAEWAPLGVQVCTCVTGSTATSSLHTFYRGAVPRHHCTISPGACAAEALNTLARGDILCLPGAANKCTFWLTKLLPPRVTLRLFADQMPPHVRNQQPGHVSA